MAKILRYGQFVKINENNQTDYRSSVANQLGIDKSEFEDSLDLGDMEDELEMQNKLYKDMKKDMEYEIEYLMKDFIENNDVSMYFTKTLSNDFDYDKELNLYNRVLRYYENTYREESGTIENDYNPLFNDVLRGAVESFLTKHLVESKEVSISHYLISKEKINASINNNSEELDKKKYALYVDEKDLSMMKIREKVKEKGFLSAIQISKDSYNKYKKYLKTVEVSKNDNEFTKDIEKDFKKWMKDDNVIKNRDGSYSTQDALYKNKLKNLEELKKYYMKEFCD